MCEYPLTALEKRLKERYLSRPDIEDAILTHQELSEYISWLAQTERRSDPPLGENRPLAEIAGQLLHDPKDKKAIRTLADMFENQREERYLAADRDISIGQMFRYMPAHWHTNGYFEIYYCFSGCCPIHMDSESITLRRGSVLILSPEVRHASPCYNDEAVLHYYMLRSSTFDKVFWNQLPADSLMSVFFRQALSHTKHTSYLHFETAGDPELEAVLCKIETEYALPGNYSGQYLNLLMSEFFLLLFRRYEGTARLPRTESFYWKHEFSAIFSFIQSHFADMTLAEIAAEFGYSERQVNRIVKSCTGDSYAHLSLRLRMERSAALLRKGTEIGLAAEASGYSTLSSFYRAFAAYYGCPPAEYKKRELSQP